MATFDKSAQNLGCPNENSETTIISPTSPKNDGIAFFKRLPRLDEFSAHMDDPLQLITHNLATVCAVAGVSDNFWIF